MPQFDYILTAMRSESYAVKKQFLEYTLNTLKKSRKTLKLDDKTAILQCLYEEMDAYRLAISSAVTYKEKDTVFTCVDLALGLFMLLCPTPTEIPEEILAKIEKLNEDVAKERYLENAIDGLFVQDTIDAPEVDELLGMAAQISDEYQKGKLYAGFSHYGEETSKFTQSAKTRVTAYLEAELKRYLQQKTLTEDSISNLEYAVDVSRFFVSPELLCVLREILELGYSNINLFAADTLLSAGQAVPNDVILTLAQDLRYAKLVYEMLKESDALEQFPESCAAPEYLAKSDLVHWLTYPTELGKAPEEIAYIGKITYRLKKDVYYVFKFRSDSDTLDETMKNKWLIGWSSEEGGTFSNFEEYALFEKETVDATLKNIKKKLLG